MKTHQLLANVRTSSGVSQSELARMLNLTPSMLADVEAGKSELSAELLEQFALKLGLSPSLLFIAVSDDPKELSPMELAEFKKLQLRLQFLLPYEAASLAD